MDENLSLSHTKCECKYHVVWIPKYRKKRLFYALRQEIGPVLRELARQKDCAIIEGHLMEDHVHMLISIPPKYSVSSVMGYITIREVDCNGPYPAHVRVSGFQTQTPPISCNQPVES